MATGNRHKKFCMVPVICSWTDTQYSSLLPGQSKNVHNDYIGIKNITADDSRTTTLV